MRTRESISAGGVAFRVVDGKYEITIIRTSNEGRWQLPKGLIDPDETDEQAAIREVREEAGIECEIVERIDSIDYWYVDRRETEPARVHKYVHFFLMKYLSGDISDHDHEVEEVQWKSIDDAVANLSFEAEKRVVEKSRSMIS